LVDAILARITADDLKKKGGVGVEKTTQGAVKKGQDQAKV